MRILIIDDHPVYRLGLAAALRQAIPGVELIEADSVHSAVQMLREEPTVVLLDLLLGDGSGVDVIDRIRATGMAPKVFVLTSVAPDAAARRLGARRVEAIFGKETPIRRLITVLRHGAGVDSPSTLASSNEFDMIASFTGRERDVLVCLARGLTNRAIAEELDISTETVKEYVSQLLNKLGVKNRTQAAAFALRHGLDGH